MFSKNKGLAKTNSKELLLNKSGVNSGGKGTEREESMAGKERLMAIRQTIQTQKKASVGELSKICRVTEETIRRDLDKLEADGVVTRVHGGAIWNEGIQKEGVHFYRRMSKHLKEKQEIARKTAKLFEGKTTMIRLILGLIHPEKGEAYLRASNGKQVEMNADTRHLFAYVPQGNTILSGTIAENLKMVKQDATEEEMIEALKISCAWDFVKNMEETIYTKIGERGRGFSEGQAQRIAIARAVLRDAPILLLDEATSALDVTTERKVLRNIIKQRPNKTCIVTTHRPSVLNMCQRVYRVMETQVTELSEEESSKMAMDF